MRIAITDASVFFDLLHIGILPEFFSLDLEVITTDFIYNEIVESGDREQFDVFVRSNKLSIISIDEKEQEIISDMEVRHSNLSFADKTILYKAIEKKWILLTCDAKLKKEAELSGLTVSGSIWVIDELIQTQRISISLGIEAFNKLKEVNAWLPLREIDERVRKLIFRLKS